MLRLFYLMPLLFALSVASAPLAAWQAELRQGPERLEIWAANSLALDNVDVYLTWLDKDGEPGLVFDSCVFPPAADACQWRAGLHPLTAYPLNLGTLDNFPLADLPQKCVEGHRCFLALVAVDSGSDALNPELWRAATLLPLSHAAAQDRMPGQTRFLPAEQDVYRDTVALEGGDIAQDTSAPSVDNGDTATTTTEKPDIFKYDGSRLLYANGQAERFQVIDVSDPARPLLSGSLPLPGSPQEVYALGDAYLLLQSDWTQAEGTRLSLIREGADGLEVSSELSLPGRFVESRRRNERVYLVSEEYRDASYIHLDAVQIDAFGHLGTVAHDSLPGYSPKIAIFPDQLVIAQSTPQDWRSTQVQVFDLSQTEPLVKLGERSVPGQIPSEFHLNVKDGLLRLVYGPEDRSAGSTLGIYDLNSPALEEIGSVSAIAPGEALFATRFVDDTAYVVTFERTDPLWVLDLSNPVQPTILGELEVPGWSEKLFFHEGLLFAVGIDDQPAPGEDSQWVRRASMSLFDVRNPMQPSLLDRFTPLAGVVSYSHSPALDDERALLLDWSQMFAALPLTAWETQTGNHLQLVSFATERFVDEGRLDLSTQVLRSLELQADILGVLGDQSFLSVARNQGQPEILAELELATNLTWVQKNAGQLWTAASGSGGLYRLYRHDPAQPQPALFRWELPRGYQSLVMGDAFAVFYDSYPLALQPIDLRSGEKWPPLLLETEEEASGYYSRQQIVLDGDMLYLSEQRAQDGVKPEPLLVERDDALPGLIAPPDGAYVPPPNMLRSWKLENGAARELPERVLPGQLLTVAGEYLLTRENGVGGDVLHLLKHSANGVRIVRSLALDCMVQQHYRQPDGLYLSCQAGGYYYPMLAADGSTTSESGTRLLKLDEQLRVLGDWRMDGWRHLQAAGDDSFLLGPSYYYGGIYEPGIALDTMPIVDMAVMPPPDGGDACEVWQVQSGGELVPVHRFACQARMTALDAQQVWQVNGFAGLSQERW